MPKTKETKIPQPKMGVIVKSSGGNQYSMKQKPKVEEPALEILENVILTPDNGLQHTTEIIGEPEKPQAGYVLFVKTITEKLDQMEREQKEKLRPILITEEVPLSSPQPD